MPSSDEPLYHAVLVGRLLRYYDPYSALDLDAGVVARDLRKFPPRKTPFRQKAFVSRRRWHIARIRFFVENPEKMDPISLDHEVCKGCFCFHGPIVVDGHHRLIAAAILRRRRILASYSGLLSTLDYLTGKTRKAPEF